MKSGRILVVDDRENWRLTFQGILEPRGYLVEIADSYEIALQALYRDIFHLAIVDVRLVDHEADNTDGLKLIAVINKDYWPTVTIPLTGYQMHNYATHPALRGERVKGFWTKTNCSLYEDQFLKVVADSVAESVLALKGTQSPKQADRLLPQMQIRKEPGRILIVEDAPNWRQALGLVLQVDDHVVLEASNSKEALRELHHNEIDLVVIDLRLSSDDDHLSGMKLLTTAYEHELPVIIVTGYGTPQLVETAYKDYGVYDFIEKMSFNSDRFRNSVWQALLLPKGHRIPLTAEQRKKFHAIVERILRGDWDDS